MVLSPAVDNFVDGIEPFHEGFTQLTSTFAFTPDIQPNYPQFVHREFNDIKRVSTIIVDKFP
ncbi:MAG: hypothetical protein SPI12_01165 [Actinomycetaceae bacterium]|nr:hypothetical protein [Actinomycetaceae bacterium]MDY6082456.1 hypothetical protein [Actinomycetaceae bacterium]